jgi:hypothetical protein
MTARSAGGPTKFGSGVQSANGLGEFSPQPAPLGLSVTHIPAREGESQRDSILHDKMWVMLSP